MTSGARRWAVTFEHVGTGDLVGKHVRAAGYVQAVTRAGVELVSDGEQLRDYEAVTILRLDVDDVDAPA